MICLLLPLFLKSIYKFCKVEGSLSIRYINPASEILFMPSAKEILRKVKAGGILFAIWQRPVSLTKLVPPSNNNSRYYIEEENNSAKWSNAKSDKLY